MYTYILYTHLEKCLTWAKLVEKERENKVKSSWQGDTYVGIIAHFVGKCIQAI